MKNTILTLVIFASIVASCVKMPKSDHIIPEPESGLKIPDDFNWKTTKEIKVAVNVTAVNAQSSDKVHVIKIYNTPLLSSGSLIATGAAKPGTPFNVTISVASITDKLYIYEMKPNGLVTVTPQEISSPSLNVKLQNNPEEMLSKSNAFIASNVAPPTVPAMPFPTNYDATINNNSALTLTGFASGESSSFGNTYKSYFIPAGFTRTASIDFSNSLAHSVLYVKGTLTINNSVSMNKCSIVILDGGSVNFNQLNNGAGGLLVPFIYIQNGGTLNVSSALSLNKAIVVNKGALTAGDNIGANTSSTVINEGTITITGTNKSFNITNNSVVYNSNIINVSKLDLSVSTSFTNDGGIVTTQNVYFTNSSVINNHGELVATVKFSNSGGGTLNNFCRITANESDVQSLTANLKEGSLWSSQSFKVNNSTINMDGGSMFLTANISNVYSMKFISTSPSFALVKSTGDMPDLRWAASEIKGNIEFVHEKLVDGTVANGRDLYQSSFSNGAILSKEQTKNIVGTSCNQSLGQITPGTPPVEPEFANYFPSQTGWGTYAFEDLWPVKGDYDLNDLVLLFRVTQITNSSNQITKLHFDYNLIASGAVNKLSTAFQLNNVLASNIKSVTGQILGGGTPFTSASNGVETGVTKAIIPLFNDTKTIVSYTRFLNTVPGEYTATTEKRVTIEFNTPVTQTDITMESFNFFIVVDTRGKEIHLPGYLGTEKFNSALATGGSLRPGDYFRYLDGMMWGLMFPESFSYPSEQNSIIDAYPHFAAWATSGGTQYPDWYSNEAGYRNEELIY